MAGRDNTLDQVVARLAARHAGVVTRRELLAAGLSDDAVDLRVRRGTLLREYRGVFRVGHRAPSVEARYLAAVKACGPSAVLSGRAAGHLLRVLKQAPDEIEVTTLDQRRVPGIETRRARRLDRRDTTRYRGVPVTRPARTLVDLAAVLPPAALARACHEAGVLHRTTPAETEHALARKPTAPGARRLRAVMRGEVSVSLSELERRFLELVRGAGLPSPATNKPAGAHRVDCRWAERGLTVELDSYRYHNSRHAWEKDRRREREAHARGEDLRRFTHDDVLLRPAETIHEVASLIARPPGARR